MVNSSKKKETKKQRIARWKRMHKMQPKGYECIVCKNHFFWIEPCHHTEEQYQANLKKYEEDVSGYNESYDSWHAPATSMLPPPNYLPEDYEDLKKYSRQNNSNGLWAIAVRLQFADHIKRSG